MPRDGTYWLSEIRAEKVCVACACGLSRRYDRAALIDRAGDWSMPALLMELARRNGCAVTEWHHTAERCRAFYGTPDHPVGADFFTG